MDCALKTLKTEGISGLFRGMTALIAREIPFNALFFGCYEAYCKAFLALGPAGRTSKSELTPLEIVAAVCACPVTIPLRFCLDFQS